MRRPGTPGYVTSHRSPNRAARVRQETLRAAWTEKRLGERSFEPVDDSSRDPRSVESPNLDEIAFTLVIVHAIDEAIRDPEDITMRDAGRSPPSP
jgi:hypothetical protein